MTDPSPGQLSQQLISAIALPNQFQYNFIAQVDPHLNIRIRSQGTGTIPYHIHFPGSPDTGEREKVTELQN